MKCTKCGVENKEGAAVCRKCGREFSREIIWMPDWKWHGRALLIIYSLVIVMYFAVSSMLHRLKPPYNMRNIAPEMTPWLKNK